MFLSDSTKRLNTDISSICLQRLNSFQLISRLLNAKVCKLSIYWTECKYVNWAIQIVNILLQSPTTAFRAIGGFSDKWFRGCIRLHWVSNYRGVVLNTFYLTVTPDEST